MDDKMSRGRHRSLRGDQNPITKLRTDQAIEAVRTYARGGVTMRELAEHYGVSAQTICNAVHKALDKGQVDLETAEAVVA